MTMIEVVMTTLARRSECHCDRGNTNDNQGEGNTTIGQIEIINQIRTTIMKSLSSGIRERHKWGEEGEKNAKKMIMTQTTKVVMLCFGKFQFLTDPYSTGIIRWKCQLSDGKIDHQ